MCHCRCRSILFTFLLPSRSSPFLCPSSPPPPFPSPYGACNGVTPPRVKILTILSPVHPSSSLASTSAPFSISTRIVSTLPLNVALINAVHLCWSRPFVDAPLSTRAPTSAPLPSSPPPPAHPPAIRPAAFCTSFTLVMPLDNSSFTIASLTVVAIVWSGVPPSAPRRASTLAPAASSNFAQSHRRSSTVNHRAPEKEESEDLRMARCSELRSDHRDLSIDARCEHKYHLLRQWFI